MNMIDGLIEKYCSEETINNIYQNHPKTVGIEYNPTLINEYGKNVGKIILITNIPEKYKLFLDSIIQFNSSKIQWKSSKVNGDFEFCLIDPYFIKQYAPDPKLKVPILINDGGILKTKMIELTFQQYKMRMMNEYYYKNKIPYTLVAAYRNFYKMLKECVGVEYKAHNSTCRNYLISQEVLIKVISRFNNERKRIIKNWNQLVSEHLQQNETDKLLERLYGRQEKEKEINNLIKLQDFQLESTTI